jgi:hypothetical protein
MKLHHIAAVAALAFAVQAHASTVVFSDNFDTDATGLNLVPAGWTVTDGTVDIIGAGSSWDYAPGNGHYIDLDGTTNSAGTLTESLNLVAGQSYQLSFSLAGSHVAGIGGNTESVTVSVGGSALGSPIVVSRNDAFQTYTFSFVAATAGPVALSFKDDSHDNVGALLDNVQVSAVPEPASVAMMLAGLGLMGVAARRRRG